MLKFWWWCRITSLKYRFSTVVPEIWTSDSSFTFSWNIYRVFLGSYQIPSSKRDVGKIIELSKFTISFRFWQWDDLQTSCNSYWIWFSLSYVEIIIIVIFVPIIYDYFENEIMTALMILDTLYGKDESCDSLYIPLSTVVCSHNHVCFMGRYVARYFN